MAIAVSIPDDSRRIGSPGSWAGRPWHRAARTTSRMAPSERRDSRMQAALPVLGKERNGLENADRCNMKQLIQFAVVVILAFGGMVVLRETGRREQTPKPMPVKVLKSSGDVATISKGEVVEIGDHLDASKWTVIEFTADW